MSGQGERLSAEGKGCPQGQPVHPGQHKLGRQAAPWQSLSSSVRAGWEVSQCLRPLQDPCLRLSSITG